LIDLAGLIAVKFIERPSASRGVTDFNTIS
jgi:hypothetical protein